MMDNVIDVYNKYKCCKKDTWTKRLTWMGLDGRHPKHTISIIRFNSETDMLDSFKGVCNVEALFKKTHTVATEYISWVAQKSPGEYSKLEFDDMHNFFIGAIGELFFYKLFVEVKRIISITGGNIGLDGLYDFSYVSPTLNTDKDGGIDFTAYINDKPSVIQIKFWNPFSNGHNIGLDIIQKLYAEGVSKRLIDNSENENAFICWLGSEKSVYDKLKDYPQYKKNIVVIGRESLGVSIDNRNKIFWNTFGIFLHDIR